MRIIIYGLVMACILIMGCDKKEVVDPTLNIKLATTTFGVGEEVAFHLEGNAGVVFFYSGEVGNEYEYASGRVMQVEDLQLNFQSRVNFGTQLNQFSVWASVDFDGEYEMDNVHAATWVEITDRFALPQADNVYASSGQISIMDLVEEGKPLYIAYRYAARPQTEWGNQRVWTIQNFSLNIENELASEGIANQLTAGWTLVEAGETIDPSRSEISGSSGIITFRGNNVNRDVDTEHWAISVPFDIREVDMGPDRAIPVKGVGSNQVDTHVHVYEKPGTYKAVFVASNHDVYGQRSIVKTIDVVITE